MNSTDIRVIFLYEYKLGNNTVKATRNINQAFGENTVNDRKVQRWFEKFWSSDFSLQNEPRGRPKRPLFTGSLANDFHFFKHLDLFLRAKQYENEESLKNSISEFINSKDQNFFKTGIYALKSRWEKCIEANGAYFD
ncbi:hypothetical protein ACFW04_011290 [Cataglyphis niger]